jgi:transposase-like protein
MEAQGKLLPQSQILKDWWFEVKENFWQENAKEKVKTLLKELMESTMAEEMTQELRRAPYDRKASVYRHGYYSRALVTQFGLIQDIQVPRARGVEFKTRVFKRYQRHQDLVQDLIEGIFLAGVSTRRVGEAISKLLDTKVSHGTVSNITKRLDTKVTQFHRASILDEYQYLILDGINLKTRHNDRYHNRKILVAYGITVFGERKLIGFMTAKGESQASWEALLNSLYRRGLKGDNLKLISMDGSAGLKTAAELVYPHAMIQRCWAHKLRNVTNYCKKAYEEELIDQARAIYQASNRLKAVAEFKAWKKTWQKIAPQAVHCLEKDLEELLNFLDCPKSHQIKIRTTNAIERAFREVRRRTRVFSCFSNIASSERIIFAIFTHLNNNWKNKPLKQFTQFD